MDAPTPHQNHHNFYVSILFALGRILYGIFDFLAQGKDYFPSGQEISKEACMAILFFAITWVLGFGVKKLQDTANKKSNESSQSDKS